MYQNEDGSYACNGSQFIDGRLYQFDGSGHRIKNDNEQSDAADEAIYRSFISQQFSGKENVRIALADLTHNGHAEMIVVWKEYGSLREGTHICVYTITQNQVKEISSKTRVVIQTDTDYGFPASGKSAEAWLDDFYARKQYWMTLRIKVKGNHIEEIYGIYSVD